MRFIILTITGIFFLSLSFAQNKVGISEVKLSTSKGDQPAFEFFLPDTDAKSVLNAWDKFHKSYKVKPKQDKDLKNYYFSDDAFIEDLSENTIDIYSRIYETSNGVKFTCALDLGGVFISSSKTPEKFTKTKLILNKFYAQMAMDAIVSEIEKELLALQEIKKEYDAIDQEISNFDKEAAEYSKTISQQEGEQEDIEEQLISKEADLNVKKKELIIKKEELKEIDRAGIVADLTSFTNDLKRTGLEATKVEKDIERKEAEIAILNADIDILKNDLESKVDFKTELKTKIEAIENRLVELDIESKEEKVNLLEQNIAEIEKITTDLDLKNSSTKRTITLQQTKLIKVKQAIDISKETKQLLQDKIKLQESRIAEMEEIKATIE